MEHIIIERKRSKINGWDREIYNLRQSNKRADKINSALTVAIYFLSFSAAVGFIYKFIG